MYSIDPVNFACKGRVYKQRVGVGCLRTWPPKVSPPSMASKSKIFCLGNLSLKIIINLQTGGSFSPPKRLYLFCTAKFYVWKIFLLKININFQTGGSFSPPERLYPFCIFFKSFLTLLSSVKMCFFFLFVFYY